MVLFYGVYVPDELIKAPRGVTTWSFANVPHVALYFGKLKDEGSA